MQDFASAAMVRLLVGAMAAHGLVPPPPPPGADGLAASHVPLAYKRSVVEAVLHQGGLGTLLQLAQRVDLLAGDPVHRALLGASGPPELMARWQRLERYVHSRHQVSVTASAPGTLALRHHARPGVPEEPHPTTESLAVLGVPIPRFTHWPAVPCASISTCKLRTPQAIAVPPQPATHLCDALPWPPLAHRLARHVLHDPAAQHTVDALARHTGLARRSLQRALTEGGLSCRHIVTEARARLAAQWLLESPHGLAEIGFACGFADQPHFTREFARHVGLTPARYRQAFARAATATPNDLTQGS